MTFILVDVGYLFFYRYHATKLWYKRAHEYTDDESMVHDIHFSNIYQKKIKDCIADLIKKYKTSWQNVIFCRDTRRSSVWRNNLADNYKGNRNTNHLTGLAEAARLMRLVIFDIVRHNNAKSIGVNGAEADDIVYAATKVIRKYDKHCSIIIVASDHDYYQILSDNINLVRLDKKNPMLLSTRYTNNLSIEKSQSVDLLVKIISGDVSDNIKPIFPRCGKKTALKLALDDNLLQSWFRKYPNSKLQFNENKKLIDMSEIPTVLLDTIMSKITNCLQL